MTYISAGLRSLVITRARSACEYCLLHSNYAGFPHEIDHVIAQKHGGLTEANNLAFSCVHCNRFKGSDIASLDPESGEIVPLFNPRTQNWSAHFQLDGPVIVPLSAAGRATERLLQLNQIDRILLRKELLANGRYPF